jgi:hypothetical protein
LGKDASSFWLLDLSLDDENNGSIESVWERGLTRVSKNFEFFLLLKFNMVCMFWIVLMC